MNPNLIFRVHASTETICQIRFEQYSNYNEVMNFLCKVNMDSNIELYFERKSIVCLLITYLFDTISSCVLLLEWNFFGLTCTAVFHNR